MAFLRTVVLLLVAATPACGLQARDHPDGMPSTANMSLSKKRKQEPSAGDAAAFINETMDSLSSAIGVANDTLMSFLPGVNGKIDEMNSAMGMLNQAVQQYQAFGMPGAEELSKMINSYIDSYNSTVLSMVADLTSFVVETSLKLSDYLALAQGIADTVFTTIEGMNETIAAAENASSILAAAASEAAAEAPRQQQQQPAAAPGGVAASRVASGNQSGNITKAHASMLALRASRVHAVARLASLDGGMARKGGKKLSPELAQLTATCAKGRKDLAFANKTMTKLGDLVSMLNGTASDLIDENLGALNASIGVLNSTIAEGTEIQFLKNNPAIQQILASALDTFMEFPLMLMGMVEDGLAEVNSLVGDSLQSLASGYEAIGGIEAQLGAACDRFTT